MAGRGDRGVWGWPPAQLLSGWACSLVQLLCHSVSPIRVHAALVGYRLAHSLAPTLPPAPCLPPRQVIAAELDYKLACSGYDVRAFVTEALESMNLGAGLAAAKAELMAALDEAEKASGGSLSGDSDKGWQVGRGGRRGVLPGGSWREEWSPSCGMSTRVAQLLAGQALLNTACSTMLGSDQTGGCLAGTRAGRPTPCRPPFLQAAAGGRAAHAELAALPPLSQVLTSKLGEIERKYGLQDKAKVCPPPLPHPPGSIAARCSCHPLG